MMVRLAPPSANTLFLCTLLLTSTVPASALVKVDGSVNVTITNDPLNKAINATKNAYNGTKTAIANFGEKVEAKTDEAKTKMKHGILKLLNIDPKHYDSSNVTYVNGNVYINGTMMVPANSTTPLMTPGRNGTALVNNSTKPPAPTGAPPPKEPPPPGNSTNLVGVAALPVQGQKPPPNTTTPPPGGTPPPKASPPPRPQTPIKPIDLAVDFDKNLAETQKEPRMHVWRAKKKTEPFDIESVWILCEPLGPGMPKAAPEEANQMLDERGKEVCGKAVKRTEMVGGKATHQEWVTTNPMSDGSMFNMEAWAVQAGNPAIDKFLTEKDWTANMCLPLLKTVLKTCSMAGGNATALIPGEGSENVPGKLKETRVMLRTIGTMNINNGGNKGDKGGVQNGPGKDKPKDGEVKPIERIKETQKGGNQTPPPPPVTQTQTLPPPQPQPGHEPGKWDGNVGKWDHMTGQWNGKIWRRIRRAA